MTSARQTSIVGFVFAIASAGTFALSGIFASALMDAGWTAGAAVIARISFAALTLLPPTLIMMRGRWGLLRRAWQQIVLFGVLAVAGCQLAFFLSVQYIPPSLALLIEFTGPVMLMVWTAIRTRSMPSIVTLVGAALAIAGLVAISGVVAGVALHPLGITFGLIAAVGLAVYFATSARSDHGIPPIPFVGLGLSVGAVLLIVTAAIGVLPFSITNSDVELAGAQVPAWTAVAGMVLISTALAYVLGVGASRRLGATVASFTGYSEPLFGIVWTIALLTLMPTGLQWAGAALILAGVIAVRIGEDMRIRAIHAQ